MDRVVVITDLAQAAGGATSLAIASAAGPRKRGVPVTYITSDGPVGDDLAATGADIVRLPGSPVSPGARLKGMAVGLYRGSVAAAVGRWIADNDTSGTVYHLHNWAKFLSPAVFRPLSRVGDRLVLTTHDFFLSCPNGAQYSFAEEAVCTRRGNSLACLSHACDRRNYADKLWRSGRHAMRQAMFDVARSKAAVVAIHEGMIPGLTLGGVPEACIEIIRNPVRPFTDARVPVEQNRDVLFVGRLTYEKGPDLAAMAAVRAGLRPRFVGAGPLEARVREIAPDAVLDGWQDREAIGAIARQARMLVMPSRWAEPYGMVAAEGLWSGLPVIASDSAYLGPEIAQAGAGFAVDTRDVDAFAQALSRLAQDDALARRMSEAALTATGHLGNTLTDWEDRHLALYERRLSEARRVQ
jgi:glycosyltransferase involved in cell wall biosynthesis